MTSNLELSRRPNLGSETSGPQLSGDSESWPALSAEGPQSRARAPPVTTAAKSNLRGAAAASQQVIRQPGSSTYSLLSTREHQGPGLQHTPPSGQAKEGLSPAAVLTSSRRPPPQPTVATALQLRGGSREASRMLKLQLPPVVLGCPGELQNTCATRRGALHSGLEILKSCLFKIHLEFT